MDDDFVMKLTEDEVVLIALREDEIAFLTGNDTYDGMIQCSRVFRGKNK